MYQTPTRDVHVRSTVPLITPIQLVERLPITVATERTVLDGRRTIQHILRGDDRRLLVVLGPCSIHDEQAALEYADRLSRLSKGLSDRMAIVMRVYFEKPRTSVGWKGFIYDPNLNGSFDIASGLHRARALLSQIGEMGLYAGTEFLDPIVPQYLGDLVSWAAIGARTTESQTHRQMASGLSMPVGFKNSTNGTTQIAVDAMLCARSKHGFLGIDRDGQTCVVETAGNPYGHLVLRGGHSGPNYQEAAIAGARQQLIAAGLRPQLMVDCSHGNSSRDPSKVGAVWRAVIDQRVAGDGDIIGCMMESHLSQGNQRLEGDRSSLRYGVSITDPCVDWEETRSLLTWAYDRLGGRGSSKPATKRVSRDIGVRATGLERRASWRTAA